MKNVLSKLKDAHLIRVLIGLIWAWQALSFANNHSIASPLSFLLPILLLALARNWLRNDFKIFPVLKNLGAAILTFSLSNALLIACAQFSKTYKIFLRAANITDSLSSKILNLDTYYFADLWLQFFIFGILLLALFGLAENNFSLKGSLTGGLYLGAAAFFAPLLGNFVSQLGGGTQGAIITTFACLAIVCGWALDEKRQLTIYEA